MATFILCLQSATQYERFEDVESFVGEDCSGSFGILAGHERMMTSLNFGLARFRIKGAHWEYIGLPRALLYFVDNELTLNTRHYLRDANFERISHTIARQLEEEEQSLRTMHESLRRMEQEMLKRLWQMGRGAESL